MKQRHLVVTALLLAVTVQAAFVAVYYTATGGCFCAITTSRPSPGPFATWTVEIGSSPLRLLLDSIGANLQIAGAAATLVFALINALAWIVSFFLLLHAVALPFRIRRGSGHSGTSVFKIVELQRVQPWWVGGAMVLLIVAGFGVGARARKQWIASAEHAIGSAVRSIRQGQPFHERPGFEVACYDDCRAERFAGPYVFRRDEASMGTHPLDRYVTPVVMSGHLRTIEGARFRVSVYHTDGVWSVLMGQA